MKYIINTLTILLVFVTPTLAQNNKSKEYSKIEEDTTSFSIIESNLKLVKTFLENKTNPDTLEIGTVISFLLDLTSIAPESFSSNSKLLYFPIKSDYDRWFTWYMLNKQYISWDKKSKKIIVRKSVYPYIPRRSNISISD